MKVLLSLVLCTILSSGWAVGMGEVISSFYLPSVLYDGEGLAWDGAYLWCCSTPNPRIYKITTTGSIVSSFTVASVPFPYVPGATYENGYIWVSTYDPPTHVAYVSRFTMTGSLVSWFGLYYDDVGLTWEPPYLWVDGIKYTTSGSIISSFPHPGVYLYDTAFVGHYIWASGAGPAVYQWTTTGSIVTSFPTPGGGFPTGKTFDGNYLWVVNRNNRYCYRVNINVVNIFPASIGRIKAIYR